ncbi:MAG: polyamine transporter ATP-binding protein [Betaproteobacteria bacterium]|nr:polyamine transporter ATP-binding protein [Betaproteobacteria bacterium]
MNEPLAAGRKVTLDIRNVSLAFGDTPVLRDISLTVEPGEFFALLGPSGCGKSTLLRLIAGFNQSQTGNVQIDGADITRIPPWQRDIGMVFQNYALWPHMTVAQNVAFGLEERRLPRAEIARKTAAALELVGLQEFGQRRPNQLSGGQQQRVAVARTIAIEPKILLLDEPLSNLDAKLRVHMRTELLALQRKLGITTIFVTHDQEEALSISDRVAVLDRGVIQQIGTPMDLYDRPANSFIASFVGTINLVRGTSEKTTTGMTFDSAVTGKIGLATDAPVTGAAEIAFRPHTLSLAAHDKPLSLDRVWVKGRVAQREFLGEFVRYRIDVRGNDIVADQPHFGGNVEFAPGSEISVGIEPAQVRVLPA